MPTTNSTTDPDPPPTAEIDRAIAHAWYDVQAARAARTLRASRVTADDVRRYEDALDGLLDRRKDYR